MLKQCSVTVHRYVHMFLLTIIFIQCLLSSPALDGGADPRKKFIGKNSKTP